MSRKHLLAATLLAPFAMAGAAAAQPISGIYIGAGAGANFMQQEQVQIRVNGQPVAYGRTSFDTGVAALGGVGWGFGNGLRLEVEGNYRRNDISAHTSFFNPGRREEKYGGMANVLFDLDVGSPYVYPYIGAGAGYVWVDRSGSINPFTSRSDREGGFAYQAIAGLSFPMPWVVGLSLTAEYRYYALTGDRIFSGVGPGPSGPAAVSLKTRGDFNHDLMLGLRYAFNVAPPPPPAAVVTPPPAAEAARTYLVFFDWDRADLTDRARQIIGEAAQVTTRVQVTRIQVNGYTDLSGTAAYNMGLSVRRAQAVANELIRDGVPRAAISIQGFGKTHPLVPTADGVREPQNRRVEIILQ